MLCCSAVSAEPSHLFCNEDSQAVKTCKLVRALILEPRAISDMPVVVWSAELREHVCRARCCILVHEKTWSLSDSGQPQNGKSGNAGKVLESAGVVVIHY